MTNNIKNMEVKNMEVKNCDICMKESIPINNIIILSCGHHLCFECFLKI